MAQRKSSKLKLQLRRSKTNPCAVRVEIGGSIGRIKVRGKTMTVFLGLDDLDRPGLAHSVTTAHRSEGGALPFGAQRKVEAAVLAILKEARKDASSC